MAHTYDVIVVGLGAAGSAAAYHLARRGLRVLGLDRYAPPHTHGSSHGTRIVRRVYAEGARYAALLARAYALWQALEAEVEKPLLHVTGGVTIGRADRAVIQEARRSAAVGGFAHALLSAAEVRDRFPAFRLREGEVALWEPAAGWLVAEDGIEAHLSGARRRRVVLQGGEPVVSWTAEGGGVRVETTRGSYAAGLLALCAGGWMPALLPALRLPLEVERQVVGYFQPAAQPASLVAPQCPVYIWEYAPGRWLYGFPDAGKGVKAGLHHGGAVVPHPDALQRAPTEADAARLRRQLRCLLPGADGPLLALSTCFYTNTPDHHYLIDVHPGLPQVAFASACSGHGFKASSAVGEVLAGLLVEGQAPVDVEAFRWRGWSAGGRAL